MRYNRLNERPPSNMEKLTAVDRKITKVSNNHNTEENGPVTPTLSTLPPELVQIIVAHLSIPTRYSLGLTCRYLRQVIDLDFRKLHRCHKWRVTTRLEKDLPTGMMPKRLACAICKQKRPVRDFGYKKPPIGEKAFRTMRQIPLVRDILHRFPSLYLRNWHVIGGFIDGCKYSPSRRRCYRHESLCYTPLQEISEKAVPPVQEVRYRYPWFSDTARYARIAATACGHCGRLTEDDETRPYGCRYCNCPKCRSPVRTTQYLRVGEGDRSDISVEYLSAPLGTKPNRQKLLLPLERGSK